MFRLRIRSLLMLVLLAALALGLERRFAYCRQQAAYHAAREAEWRAVDAAAHDSAGCKRAEIEYHSRRKQEYRRWWWQGPVIPASCHHPRR